ncbi:MAG: ABC transporter permease [Isosphaeraceae bacterium]|nr:ABC transporter permease [Isosphaeraceae bacterium]
MLPGPVFRFELITTARRPRYFVARTLYGLFLLFVLWQEYQSWGNVRFVVTFESMSRFAQATFMAFAWAQGFALIAMIPALLAGVIADEYQRKTLHYLLASRLTSREIVLGKLCARLLYVGVILLMGVPVVSLVALFGGLDPWEVLYVYSGTFSLVLFLSGASLLISVLTTRPRVAVVITYTLVFIWFFVPMALAPTAAFFGPPLDWVKPVTDAVLLTNPYQVWQKISSTNHHYNNMIIYNRTGAAGWLAMQMDEAIETLVWMVGLQTALGALFLTLAVASLRPLRGGAWPGVRKPARVRWRSLLSRSPRLWNAPARPPCGDDENPVLWKEKFAAGGGLTWLRSRPVVLVLSVLLGCYLLDAGWPVVADWFGMSGGQSPRLVLNGALRESSTFLFLLLTLSVASAGAVSLTGEREGDSWVSLTATLLTGDEIVRGKILGALWCSQRLFLALFVMWGYGLLLGAIHPLGALLALLGLGLFTWFAAALGVFISLRAKNSTRALAATVFWLIVFNGGYLVVFIPFLRQGTDMLLAGMTPYAQWLALFSYADIGSLWRDESFQVAGFAGRHGWETFGLLAIAYFVYGVGALLLTGAAAEAFDKVDDRPRRSVDSRERVAVRLEAPTG